MDVPDDGVDLLCHVEGDGEDTAGVLAEGDAATGEQGEGSQG